MSQGDILPIVHPEMDDGNNRAMVSQWEKGDREPQRESQIRYAELAGISLDTLLRDDVKLPAHIESFEDHFGNDLSETGKSAIKSETNGHFEDDFQTGAAEISPSSESPNENSPANFSAGSSLGIKSSLDVNDLIEEIVARDRSFQKLILSDRTEQKFDVFYLQLLEEIPYQNRRSFSKEILIEVILDNILEDIS